MSRPIVIDGLTVGSWKRSLQRRSATVEATLFTGLDPAQSRALRSAIERFGRFLDLPVELQTRTAA